jgi:hypothetical protein
MATFRSVYLSLALQGDEVEPWARFVDGVLVTDDEALAERLRGAQDVTEDVEPEAPQDVTEPAKTTRKRG